MRKLSRLSANVISYTHTILTKVEVIRVGKVRPLYIKRAARQLFEKYPNRFTESFEENKKAIAELTSITSKRVRNRVAGYITRLVKRKKRLEEMAIKAAEHERSGEESEE